MARLYYSRLQAGLNQVITQEYKELNINIKFYLIKDWDFIGLLVSNGIYIKDRAVGGNTIGAQGAGGNRSILFGRGYKDTFFLYNKDVVISPVTYIQNIKQAYGRKKERGVQNKT